MDEPAGGFTDDSGVFLFPVIWFSLWFATEGSGVLAGSEGSETAAADEAAAADDWDCPCCDEGATKGSVALFGAPAGAPGAMPVHRMFFLNS